MDSLLNKLINAFGASGHEEKVKDIIKEEMDKIGLNYEEDRMGNVIVNLKSYINSSVDEEKKERVMFSAHMDSIGLIVTYIDENGFAKLGSIGNFSAQSIVNSIASFQNGTLARICCSKEKPEINDLFLDFGFKSREQALEHIKEGNTAVIKGEIINQNGMVMAPALDNRAGCYILIKALQTLVEKIKKDNKILENIKKENREYYFVFSSQSQLGGRGARAAAYKLEPDYAIVIDVESAEDTSANKSKFKIGQGVGIKIMDRTLVVHPEVKDMLYNTAKENNIKFQYVVGQEGTDGATIHKEASGAKTGILSLACRYLHTPEEMIDLKDVEDAINMIVSLIIKK